MTAAATNPVVNPPPSADVSSPSGSDVFARLFDACDRVAAPRSALSDAATILADHFAASALTLSVVINGQVVESSAGAPGKPIPEAWTSAIRTAILDAHARGAAAGRLYGPSADRPEVMLISAPIYGDASTAIGAVALVAPCTSSDHAQRAQLELRAVAAHLARLCVAPRRVVGPVADPADLARVLARAGTYRSLKHFTYSVVGALRAKLACDQVMLATVNHDHVRLLAVSGIDDFKHRSPGARLIEQAMSECADSGEAIRCGAPEDEDSSLRAVQRFPLHHQWMASSHAGAVLSVPLLVGDTCIAVVSLRRADRPFLDREVQTATGLLAPLGAALPVIERATRSPVARASHAARSAGRWIVNPTGWGRKLVLVGLLAAAAWFCLGSMDYVLTVPTVVTPLDERVITTASPGRITAVLVAPGDAVTAGQVLVKLDTSDLSLSLAETRAEIDGMVKEADRLTREGDPAQAAIAQAKLIGARARAASIQRRIDRCELRAPADGVVLGPRLDARQGSLVAPGEPLMRLSLHRDTHLELHIPERLGASVPPDASLVFRAYAQPQAPIHASLERVHPSTDVREDKVVFIGEANATSDAEWIRPGMLGQTTITVGRRRVWWVALHRVIESAHLHFGRALGDTPA